MKTIELRKKPKEELKSLLEEKRARVEELRALLNQKKIKNVRDLAGEKKDIARILTILEEKQ